MEVSVAQIKARFTEIAKRADAGENVVITSRGKPAYRLLPIVKTQQRQPFPDVTALALQSRPYVGLGHRKPGDTQGDGFVADWRAHNERF